MTHRYYTVNGVRLHVAEAGPKEGPLVVLLHGFPEFWYGWRRQMGALADAGYRVLAPDQRGYNLSDKPPHVGDYGIDYLTADVVGLIEAAGHERAAVVGHDWGAVVAWALAEHHAEHLTRAAMLNVPHPRVMAQTLRHSREQLRKSWYMFFFQIPWLPEWLLGRNDAHLLTTLLRRTSRRGSFTEADLERYREAWRQPGALRGMVHWYRAAARRFLERRPRPSIDVPTLLIWGMQDVALSAQMAQPSIDLCTHGRLERIETATHWVQHDAPDEVNRLLLAFLKEAG